MRVAALAVALVALMTGLAGGSAPAVTAAPSAPTGASTAKLTKTFVSAKKGVVTWELAPESPADMVAWDDSADSCKAQHGADCGTLGAGGYGSFSADGKEKQVLRVTQPYTTGSDGSCDVENTARWAASPSDDRETVTARYRCSRASTLGWPLYVGGVSLAVASIWLIRRRRQW
jgi:hypothetical protein